MAGLAVAGWVVTGFISKFLYEPVYAYLKDQVQQHSGLTSKLENLRNRLLDIEPLLPIAEQKMANNRRLAELLRNLEDAVYDAEDLLDEFPHPDPDSSQRKRKLQVEDGDVRGKRTLTSNFAIGSHVITRHNLTPKIAAVTKKLDSICENIVSLLKLLKLGASHQRADDGPAATWRIEPAFKVEEMIGRDEEKTFLKSMLSSSSHIDGGSSSRNGLSVLTIVGIGGLGKTTLARSLFHDDDIKKEFQLRIWVCVSDDFNLLRLTKEILEGVTGKTVTNNSNLSLLQTDLQERMMSRTFLLVLDDVWEKENENLKSKWNSLLGPLINNSANQESSATKGSKIIVTTRDEEVAKIMCTTKPLRLSTLPVDVFRQFFLSCAFEGANPDDYPAELENIAKEIATKLGCLPLAAKTVGALLSSKRDSELNKEHWRSILESEIWRLPMKENDIMPALRVSYNHLPSHLKQCFAYCAIFPKDYMFGRDYLILHWLAHGYIHPQNRATRVEATGEEYFDDLYRRSFFQPTGEDNKYVMHELIHDLAQSVSEHQCFIIEDQKHKQIPKTVRHLSLSICTNNEEVALRQLKSFNELKKLRTLVFFRRYVPEMIPKLERVRVLDFYGYPFQPSRPTFEGFPEDIVCLKHLKHLRYLNLRRISCSVVPKQICNLHHLQVLYFPLPEGLPEGLSDLINLRHLIGDDDAISRITGVHKLKDLQKLKAFEVLYEHGHELSELKEMNQIRGSLRIENLNVVVDKKKAEDANLLQKKNLRELELRWTLDFCRDDGNNDGRADEDVIEGLQPSPSLEKLVICGCNGRSSPSWINMQMLPNLTHVKLHQCEKWDVLTPLGQLPHLKHLELCRMLAIRIFGGYEFYGDANFPSLESLIIDEMVALEEWRGVEGHQYLPSLRKLRVASCPKLRTLPLLPPKLEVLELWDVGLLSLFSSLMASRDTDGGMPESSDSVSSNRLQVPGRLKAVENLDIYNCSELTALGSFQGLVSLQILQLNGCPRLQVLPEELHSLSSLRFLSITSCPKIRSLPLRGLPLGLQVLSINWPNEELRRSCLESECEDRPKIEDIPYVSIWP